MLSNSKLHSKLVLASALSRSKDVDYIDASNKMLKEVDKELHKKYGEYEGHRKWQLTKDWLQMSNDHFFDLYGFNWVPPINLQSLGKEYLFRKSQVSSTSYQTKETEIPDMRALILVPILPEAKLAETLQDSLKNISENGGLFNGKR